MPPNKLPASPLSIIGTGRTALGSQQGLGTLEPQVQASAEHVRQRGLYDFADLSVVIPRAEMGGDDHIVIESVLSGDEIVQVHMPVFVDFVLAVVGCHERHLGDQHLRVVHGGAIVQAWRRTVAKIA